MKLRRVRNSWAVCAFALALLLKAAAPLLAAASAQMQGKALADVCTVYGVATVGSHGPEWPTSHDGPAAHAGDHCTLSALLSCTPSEPQSWALNPVSLRAVSASPGADAQVHDACAAWVARLKQGPPRFA